MKHKTNKGRTIKKRMKTASLTETINGKAAAFLQDTYPYDAVYLQPKLWVNYSRITLVSLHRQERVTVDLNLSFSWKEQAVSLSHLVIVEVKRERASHRSDIEQQLHHHHVRATGFSKYCVGTSLIYPELKHNNFKAKLRLVEKLAQGGANVYLN